MIGCSISSAEGESGLHLVVAVLEIISADEFHRGKCPCRCMPSRPWPVLVVAMHVAVLIRAWDGDGEQGIRIADSPKGLLAN